jgi:hypothetical protein
MEVWDAGRHSLRRLLLPKVLIICADDMNDLVEFQPCCFAAPILVIFVISRRTFGIWVSSRAVAYKRMLEKFLSRGALCSKAKVLTRNERNDITSVLLARIHERNEEGPGTNLRRILVQTPFDEVLQIR